MTAKAEPAVPVVPSTPIPIPAPVAVAAPTQTVTSIEDLTLKPFCTSTLRS